MADNLSKGTISMSADSKKKRIATPEEGTGCEFCLCCACERTCMLCARCSPMSCNYIPLIGCKKFIDMRNLKPLRYIYSGDPLAEYPVHIPLP